MLILSRKTNQRITIGDGPDQITILVVALRNGKARLGIEAPAHLRVLRDDAGKRCAGDST